jgi:hypothetical protein
MKSKNLFVPCVGEDLTRLEEEYAFIGRYTRRVEGGITVMALTPSMKKNSSGEWVWVFSKPKKNAPARPRKRDEDEERPKSTRDQKPKARQ